MAMADMWTGYWLFVIGIKTGRHDCSCRSGGRLVSGKIGRKCEMEMIIGTGWIIVGFIAKVVQDLGAWLLKPPTNGDLLFVVGCTGRFVYTGIKTMLGNMLIEIQRNRR